METEIDRLRKKVENFPSASSYVRLAELLRGAGDDAEAERICRKCIKEFPRNGQAYVILAEIALAAKRRDEAASHLAAGIEKDPRNYAAHKLLADLLAESGNAAQAVVHLRQILGFKPNDPAIVKRIAELEPQAAARPAAGSPPAAAPRQGTGAVVRRTLGAAPAGAPAKPPAAPAGAAPAARSGPPAHPLDALCAEPGVRGALIADASGRTIQARNLKPEQEDILSALAAELGSAGAAALAAIGQSTTAAVILAGSAGQVLRFARGGSVAVVVLADPGVRPAMLELRARQAIIELGAA